MNLISCLIADGEFMYIYPGKWCLIGVTCLAMRCQHTVHNTAGAELAGIFQSRTKTSSTAKIRCVCVPAWVHLLLLIRILNFKSNSLRNS